MNWRGQPRSAIWLPAIAAVCAGTLVAPMADAARGKKSRETSEQIDVKAFQQPSVTIKLKPGTLGGAVRRIGEEFGGSLVLMKGIETLPVGALRFDDVEIPGVAEALAAQTGCNVEVRPNYCFVYPPGYEMLTGVSLEGQLDPVYADMGAEIALGASMSLTTAFQLIGQVLDTTVVADNAVAAAECGELTLGAIPLEDALEAVLKSARVPRPAVDSTSEFNFIYHAGNPSPRSFLLKAETLDKRQNALLETRVDVVLPWRPSDPTKVLVPPAATPLEKVLKPLSEQLGVRVMAEADLAEVPIEAAILRGVRIRTAIDLLIRQWPIHEFGYEMTPDGILIRQAELPPAPAPETPPQPVPPPEPEPESAPTPEVEPADVSEPSAEPPDATPPKPASEPKTVKITYTVEFGDTAWTVARKHKVSLEDFLQWNDLAYGAAILPGEKYILHVRETQEPSEDASKSGEDGSN